MAEEKFGESSGEMDELERALRTELRASVSLPAGFAERVIGRAKVEGKEVFRLRHSEQEALAGNPTGAQGGTLLARNGRSPSDTGRSRRRGGRAIAAALLGAVALGMAGDVWHERERRRERAEAEVRQKLQLAMRITGEALQAAMARGMERQLEKTTQAVTTREINGEEQ